MKSRAFLFAILIVTIGSKVIAQTSVSGIVTDSLNNPIPYASVYLSKTTIGTLTDNKGAYYLSIPQNGTYEIIASFIGYKPASQIFNAGGGELRIQFRLHLHLVQLNEIVIKSKDKNRFANYKLFLQQFLGETHNSLRCKIINPEDLQLYVNDGDNSLNGFSLKPLRIENKALGYTTIYDLLDFNYNLNTGLLKFTGNHYFQPLTGSEKDSIRWARNRLSAYYGSKMHFFRSVFSDNLNSEKFKLFEYKTDTITGEKITTSPLARQSLTITKDNDCIKLYTKRPVLIKYSDIHSRVTEVFNSLEPPTLISTLIFSDSVKIYKNGYFENPYLITWGGDMGDERIGDMLPFDFQPDQSWKNDLTVNSDIENYLSSRQSALGKEQLFVHTDRNMYYPGDTIYFQAYIKDRFSGAFESSSVSLYAVLYNEKHIVADSSRFRVINATSSGWMVVPADSKSGKYHFVAFTGMMQNYDPIDVFQTDFFIVAKGSEPGIIKIALNKAEFQPGDTIQGIIKVYDKNGNPFGQQKLECNLLTDNYKIDDISILTDNQGKSDIRFIIPDTVSQQPKLVIAIKNTTGKSTISKNLRIPFANRFLDLSFLPEGGTFITGVDQRVGFNATNNRGESVHIEGLLKAGNGQIIDTIRSGIYGPGIFRCVPLRGMYIELIKGISEKKTWPLPVPDSSGICLRVSSATSRSFTVEVQSDNIKPDTLTVLGTMNANEVFSNEITLNRKAVILVNTDELPSGVIQITVFNSKLRPLAERMIYVNADKHIKFNIETNQSVYNPAGETELSVSATDGSGAPVDGVFSIAVVDSVSGHNPEIFTPGIEYTMNYNPYFLGNLPSSVLIKGFENLTDEDRDLLLMVYGWKKYNWDFRTSEKTDKDVIDYDILKLKILYASKKRRADRRIDLVSLEGPSMKHLVTDMNGEVSLAMDSLPEITRSVTMMPDMNNKNIVTSASLGIPFNQQYFNDIKLFIPSPSLPVNTFSIINKYHPALSLPAIPPGEKMIELPEVAVTAMKQNKREYHDQYEEMYQYANIRSIEPKQLWTSLTLKDAIYRMISPYKFNEEVLVLSLPRSIIAGPIEALFVLDGMPIYQEGWRTVKTISPQSITSLTILRGSQGYTLYGHAAAGGIVFINTRARNPNLMKLKTEWRLQHSDNKMVLPIGIFRPTVEYYNPKKADIESDPYYHRHSTIYWKSEVYFDGKQAVKIKYTNLKRTGPVIVTINGISSGNLVGNGKANYQVNENK